jgi:hypothetical protein
VSSTDACTAARVLLADVDRVADLREDVRERAGRQERLEHRGPVGVVGLPQALGEDGLACAQVDRHHHLLDGDPVELDVELLELADLGVVGALDDVDLGRHRVDRRLDRGQVGVDAGQLALGRVDLGAEVGLEGVDLVDLRLLGGKLLGERGLAGAGVAELIRADRRRWPTDQPDKERDQDEERESRQAAQPASPTAGVGRGSREVAGPLGGGAA